VSQVPVAAAPGQQRIGIVGCGAVAHAHADAWRAVGRPAVALLASGQDATTAARPGDRLWGIRVVSQPGELFDEVDVVDICSPAADRLTDTLAAAEAGKPALCATALAANAQDAAAIVRAFEQAAIPVVVADGGRRRPEYAAARTSALSGEIGEPAVLRLSRMSPPPDRTARPPGAGDAAAIFFELMIGDLDYARWVAGDVASVYAARSGGGPGYALAILKHHGGAITHVEASWARPLARTMTEVEIAGSLGLVGFRSEATRPISLRIDPPPLSTPASASAQDERPLANDLAEELGAELEQLLAIAGGAPDPVSSPADALEAVRLAQAAARSALTGAPVTLARVGGHR
jgi:predicted dehydrogenase